MIEIEELKIGLWNIRAENLRAIQCSLADTEDKTDWLKEIDIIDNALNYINQLENKLKKLEKELDFERKTSNQIHEYDMDMIDKLKGEIVQMRKENQ